MLPRPVITTIGSSKAAFQCCPKFSQSPTLIIQRNSTVVRKYRNLSTKTVPNQPKVNPRQGYTNSWNRNHSSVFASSTLLYQIFSMSASSITPYKWSSSNPSIIETSWLAEELKNPKTKVKVFDVSWSLQNSTLTSEYLKEHIPGAILFDIDTIADTSVPLPHMLPSPEDFAKNMDALGVSNDDHIVLYDRSGSYIASARAWWTFAVFGHKNVSVLEGGLPKWLQEGRAVVSGEPQIKPCSGYKPVFNASMVESVQQMLVNIQQKKQMVDARPAGRFEGVDPEPRPHLRGGHIPGSKCVPWSTVLHKKKEDEAYMYFLPPGELAQAYKKEGINPNEPVITTCGSGVTAAVLSLGLHLLGNTKSSLYDGAWAEWGKESLEGVTPVEKGKAK